MKKLNLILIVFTLFLGGKIFAQGNLPAPIKSAVLDASLGTWISDPYQMMGGTNTDEVTQKMILNGQFLEVDIHSTGENGFVYDGMEIVAPSITGTSTGWYFDVFGKNSMNSYTSSSDGSKITIMGTGANASREIIINGNTMIHNVTFKMKGPDGNYLPEQKATITYHKKM